MKILVKSQISRKLFSHRHRQNSLWGEIEILCQLSHPNVIRAHEIINDIAHDRLYLILDYASRGPILSVSHKGNGLDYDHSNLRKVHGTISEDVLRRYFKQFVSGLLYLHDEHIIHGDVHPTNVLITGDGLVKISDFTVSEKTGSKRKAPSPAISGNNTAESDAVEVGASGDYATWVVRAPTPEALAAPTCDLVSSAHGAPAFLAPETGLRGWYRGCPLDVWAAGVTLYALTYGRCPFVGASVDEVAHVALTQPLVLHDFGVDDFRVSQELKDLISRMLTKDPNVRITILQVSDHPWLQHSL
eukprot:Rmarinus@m.23448